MRIAVAVSGGIDSLCALCLLKSSGEQVFALHGIFQDNQPDSGPLRKICESLGIPLEIVDLRAVFNKYVIQPFMEAYANGLTPNPCAFCNKNIKFGFLFAAAKDLGAIKLATGHYVRRLPNPYGPGYLLGRACDSRKDQSYFLALLENKQIEHTLFPLSETTKEDCKKIIKNSGIASSLQRESQDICFVSGKKYSDYVKNYMYANSKNPGGPVYLRETDSTGTSLREIGSHHGLWKYTEGQRKGLNIPWREPLYVLEKDLSSNSLIVGSRSFADMEACAAKIETLHVQPEKWPPELLVKLRYNQPPLSCAIAISGQKMQIRLKKPAFSSACGQLAVVYDLEGLILASGIITKIERS